MILDAKGNPVFKAANAALPTLDQGFFFDNRRTVSIADMEKAPYLYHATVYACAKVISTNICRLKHVLYEKESEDSVITNHPILSIFEYPNPQMTEKTFWQSIVLNLLLNSRDVGTGGQCFLIPWNSKKDQKVNIQNGELPDQLYPYNDSFFEPWTEKIKSTGRMKQVGWKFRIGGSKESEIDFYNEEIIRVYLVNPYDVLKGAAPYTAAYVAVDQDAKADLYNTRLFENDARVAGLLSTDQSLNKQQARELLERWYENYGGMGNVNRTAVLGNGLKYQQFGLSNADLQFKDQKLFNRDQILGTFGLNKIAIGNYEQINLATLREGRKMLWTDTYIPLDECIWDAMNGQWIRYADNGKYRGKSDYSKVDALTYDNLQKYQAAIAMTSQAGVPFGVACKILGLSLSNDILKEYPALLEEPAITIAGQDTAKPAEDTEDEDSGPPTGEDVKYVKSAGSRFSTKEERLRFSDTYIKAALEPTEKKMIADTNKYFFRQRNWLLDRVDDYFKGKKAIKEISDFQLYLSASEQDEELKEFIDIYRKNAKIQATIEKSQIEIELGKRIKLNVSDALINKYVSKRIEDFKNINTNTFRVASDVVAQSVKVAYDEGLTWQETAKMIKDGIHAVYDVRTGAPIKIDHEYFDLGGMSSSKTIARTEMGIVASESRFDAFRNEGIEQWEWVTSRDDKVRPTHEQLDERHTKVMDTFPGSELRYPRDPSGEPGEIINCRCVAVAYFA